jgi:hypothetical protein
VTFGFDTKKIEALDHLSYKFKGSVQIDTPGRSPAAG